MSASFRRRMLPYVLISPLVVFIGALSFVPTARHHGRGVLPGYAA